VTGYPVVELLKGVVMVLAELERAAHGFYIALASLLAGDVDPMLEIWSHADDVTYLGPFGELLVGWGPIRDALAAQAAQHLGGVVEPEELHFVASPTLGVVVGYERGANEIDGAAVPVDIRATSVYRLEDGHWLMIGHHTDRLG
jgi:ketosteroid isomerase-like protein